MDSPSGRDKANTQTHGGSSIARRCCPIRSSFDTTSIAWVTSPVPGMIISISSRNAKVAWITGIALALFTFLYISSPHISTGISSLTSYKQFATRPLTSPALSRVNSKYAYVTLLGKDALHNQTETDLTNDVYFSSLRTLGWSLLHAKDSKSEGIPYIVLAVPGVNPDKTARLEKDGAIVLHVEPVPVPDWVPKPFMEQWQDVWAKLRLFELEQFEKVIFMDADVIVSGKLDVIFETTLIQETNKSAAIKVDHKSTLPQDYVFCAGIETSVDHHFPPTDLELEKGQYINAGMFVARPSIKMLNHYMSVLNIPDSFNPIAQEQNLLNQVHRKDGPMPFQQLDWHYNAYRPTEQDVFAGALSYHAKYWSLDHKELTLYMQSFVDRAMGFYEAWDEFHER